MGVHLSPLFKALIFPLKKLSMYQNPEIPIIDLKWHNSYSVRQLCSDLPIKAKTITIISTQLRHFETRFTLL